jgi:nitroimidazol reductase NimA-like FMN-containing flavoprotein (pyridoxamine 5'-phosphate oxidase superfamily)
VNSNLFVYDEAEHVLYMHTARVGRTRANIETAARVCFTVGEMGRLLPADVALDFSVEYRSVVVFGTASVIEDEAEAARALQLLLDKYFPHLKPGQDYRPSTPEELSRTSVYRINIEQWSGKQKRVGPDFPGAFFYGQPPTSEDPAENKTG